MHFTRKFHLQTIDFQYLRLSFREWCHFGNSRDLYKDVFFLPLFLAGFQQVTHLIRFTDVTYYPDLINGIPLSGCKWPVCFFPIESYTRLPEKDWKDFRSGDIIKKGKCVWGWRLSFHCPFFDSRWCLGNRLGDWVRLMLRRC